MQKFSWLEGGLQESDVSWRAFSGPLCSSVYEGGLNSLVSVEREEERSRQIAVVVVRTVEFSGFALTG